MMRNLLFSAHLPPVALSPAARADQPPYVSIWEPTQPGIAYAFAGSLRRNAGSSEILRDFTVAAQLTAQNGAGVHQWAFGVAAEAWALPGSRSILVGVESAVINEEPTNLYPKVASECSDEEPRGWWRRPRRGDEREQRRVLGLGATRNRIRARARVRSRLARHGRGPSRRDRPLRCTGRSDRPDRPYPHPQGRVAAL